MRQKTPHALTLVSLTIPWEVEVLTLLKCLLTADTLNFLSLYFFQIEPEQETKETRFLEQTYTV